MQARFGEGFFFTNKTKKEIIYSIRLVPGSNPGQPTLISKFIEIHIFFFLIHFFYLKEIRIGLGSWRNWLTRTYKSCYTVQ